MYQILQKHWPVLQLDPSIEKFISQSPSITYRKSKNLRALLVRRNMFGTKGPRWGCFKCGNCVACKNILNASTFNTSDGKKTYKILHNITCNTEGIVYLAQCPCGLSYVGLTSRKLKIHTREHVLDIQKSLLAPTYVLLKSLPRHFCDFHNGDPSRLMMTGMDKVFRGQRGGNWRRVLAQLECKWITTLNTIHHHGLNEVVGFSPFL